MFLIFILDFSDLSVAWTNTEKQKWFHYYISFAWCLLNNPARGTDLLISSIRFKDVLQWHSVYLTCALHKRTVWRHFIHSNNIPENVFVLGLLHSSFYYRICIWYILLDPVLCDDGARDRFDKDIYNEIYICKVKVH